MMRRGTATMCQRSQERQWRRERRAERNPSHWLHPGKTQHREQSLHSDPGNAGTASWERVRRLQVADPPKPTEALLLRSILKTPFSSCSSVLSSFALFFSWMNIYSEKHTFAYLFSNQHRCCFLCQVAECLRHRNAGQALTLDLGAPGVCSWAS